MKKIKLTITGNPKIKKNSRKIGYNRRTGRMFPMKSDDLVNAEWDAVQELRKQYTGQPISSPIWIRFLFFRGDKRRVDLSNLYEFPQDVMQRAGVIVDDYLIESHDGSRRLYDAINPRTEIFITLFK